MQCKQEPEPLAEPAQSRANNAPYTCEACPSGVLSQWQVIATY